MLRVFQVLVTPYNSLGGGRYYDVESNSSFQFDHSTQVRLFQGSEGIEVADRHCRKPRLFSHIL